MLRPGNHHFYPRTLCPSAVLVAVEHTAVLALPVLIRPWQGKYQAALSDFRFLGPNIIYRDLETTTFIIGHHVPQPSSLHRRLPFIGIDLRTAEEGFSRPLWKCIFGFSDMSFWAWNTHFGGRLPWSQAVLVGLIVVCLVARREEGGVYSHRRGAVLSGFVLGPPQHLGLHDLLSPPWAVLYIRVW
jgi:hypothetical protein